MIPISEFYKFQLEFDSDLDFHIPLAIETIHAEGRRVSFAQTARLAKIVYSYNEALAAAELEHIDQLYLQEFKDAEEHGAYVKEVEEFLEMKGESAEKVKNVIWAGRNGRVGGVYRRYRTSAWLRCILEIRELGFDLPRETGVQLVRELRTEMAGRERVGRVDEQLLKVAFGKQERSGAGRWSYSKSGEKQWSNRSVGEIAALPEVQALVKACRKDLMRIERSIRRVKKKHALALDISQYIRDKVAERQLSK